MSELREWQKPLSEDKIAMLVAQFAELRTRFASGGFSPAMRTITYEQLRNRRRGLVGTVLNHGFAVLVLVASLSLMVAGAWADALCAQLVAVAMLISMVRIRASVRSAA